MQIWSIWLYDQLGKKYPAINLKKMSDATLKYSCIVQLRQNIKGFSVIRVFKDNRVLYTNQRKILARIIEYSIRQFKREFLPVSNSSQGMYENIVVAIPKIVGSFFTCFWYASLPRCHQFVDSPGLPGCRVRHSTV